MKKLIILFIVSLIATPAFAQIEYVTEYDVPYTGKTDDYSAAGSNSIFIIPAATNGCP